MNLQPNLNIVSSIILGGVLQALLLSFLFLKNRKQLVSLYFGLISIVIAIVELEFFLNYTAYITLAPHFVNVSTPFIFLLGPLLFFLVQKTINQQKKIIGLFIHLTPAICYFLYSLFFYLQPAAFKVNSSLNSFHALHGEKMVSLFSSDPLHIRGFVVIEGLAIHLFLYVIISLAILIKYAKHVSLSSKRNIESLKWAKFLCINLLLGSVIFLLTGGVINGQILFRSFLPPYFINVYTTFFIYSSSGYWLRQALLSTESSEKYLKSALPKELKLKGLEQIKDIMVKQKPYKEADFSLDQLAKKVSLSSHHLSQIINTEMKMTFTDFINFYRIQEAQIILKEPEQKNLKVETLAYDLGYQSKSAFFNAFKRYTNTTPARFRELELES